MADHGHISRMLTAAVLHVVRESEKDFQDLVSPLSMHPRKWYFKSTMYFPAVSELGRTCRVLPSSLRVLTITTMTSAKSYRQDSSNSFHFCASRHVCLLDPMAEFW